MRRNEGGLSCRMPARARPRCTNRCRGSRTACGYGEKMFDTFGLHNGGKAYHQLVGAFGAAIFFGTIA